MRLITMLMQLLFLIPLIVIDYGEYSKINWSVLFVYVCVCVCVFM